MCVRSRPKRTEHLLCWCFEANGDFFGSHAMTPVGPPADTTARPAISRHYAAYALGLLTAINLLNYLDRNVIFALFQPLKHDLGFTDTQLGWLGSAYILVYSLAALPFGVLSDLRSRRAVIAGGVAVWSAFTFLGGLVRSFWQLFACRAVVGIGEAAFAPAASSLVADYYPGRSRAAAMGVLSAGLALGGLLGILLGGAIEQHYGWRVAFMMVGVPGFLLALLASRLIDPSERGVRIVCRARSIRMGKLDRTPFGHDAGTALDGLLDVLRRVLRTPTLVYVFVAGAMISFGMNGLVGWGPTFVTRKLGISSGDAARLLGITGLIAGVSGTLVGGLLADWWLKRNPRARVLTVALGMLMGGPLTVWLMTVRDPASFRVLFGLAFFFLSWYNGPLSATVFDVVPGRISATVAGTFFLFIHLAGDAIAFPLVGTLSDRFGLERAMFVLPAVSMAGGMVVLGAAGKVMRDVARVEAESVEADSRALR
jgi:MFS family permease